MPFPHATAAFGPCLPAGQALCVSAVQFLNSQQFIADLLYRCPEFQIFQSILYRQSSSKINGCRIVNDLKGKEAGERESENKVMLVSG